MDEVTLEAEASGSVIPDPNSPYADLGEVEPVNLICFAYQIASGMVSPIARAVCVQVHLCIRVCRYIYAGTSSNFYV